MYLLKAIIKTLGDKSYITFLPLSDLHIEFQVTACKQQLDLNKAENKTSSDLYSQIVNILKLNWKKLKFQSMLN